MTVQFSKLKVIQLLLMMMVVVGAMLIFLPTQPSEGQGDGGLDFAFSLYTDDLVVGPSGEIGTWDRQAAFSPSIVERDGVFYMFYTGYDGSPNVGGINIGLATSTDGIAWESSANNPLLREYDIVDQASFPAVFVDDDGTWVMLFNHVTLNSGYPQSIIYRATASVPEGPWTIDSEPTVSSQPSRWDTRLSPRNVLRIDGQYYLYYSGLTSRYKTAQMGLLTSTDGLTWTFYDDPATTDAMYDGSDPIFTVGEAEWESLSITPSNVVASDNGFELFYLGYDRDIAATGDDVGDLKMGYATSVDGIQWTRYGGNPILETILEGWPTHTVLMMDDTYYIYVDRANPNGISLYTGTILSAE